MRYLGLDLGTKTLGLSISDKTGSIASFYKTLYHDNDVTTLLSSLLQIIKEEEIDAIVLGYPKNMNNTIGPRAKATEDFKKLLEDKCGLDVFLMDERLSTVTAEKTMILGNTSRKKRKKKIDSLAATIILQSYLDWKGREK